MQLSSLIPLPMDGLDDRDPLVAEKTRASDLRNVRTHRQRVVKGPGGILWAAAVPGTPRNLSQVFFNSPSEKFLLLTHTKAFVWNGTAWIALGAETYTGAASERFSIANTQDRAVWSQGTNNLRIYDGTTVSELVAFAAKTLLAFNDRIVAVNTVEV